MNQVIQIKELINPLIVANDLELYEVTWLTEGKNHILQIAIMHHDGTMDIDTCAAMSEKLSERLDEADLIGSEYFLEVCSPGAERELRSPAQIADAVGNYIYVKLKDPKAGMDEYKGFLTAYANDIVSIEYMLKAVKKNAEIEMDNIELIRLSVKI